MGCSMSKKAAAGAIQPTIMTQAAPAQPNVLAKPEPVNAAEFKEKLAAPTPQPAAAPAQAPAKKGCPCGCDGCSPCSCPAGCSKCSSGCHCALPAAPLQVKALTYNLQWWSLYGERKGNDGSATTIIEAAMPDVMGLQECEDVTKVMIEGGLSANYTAVQGPHALAAAFKTATWELVGEGHEVVAVDETEQFFSSRSVMWLRLVHKESKKAVFFVNHHGPLRINSGGRHGGPATAEKIVQVIHCNTHPGDGVIMVGTFNAQVGSQTVRELEGYLPRTHTGIANDGIDHFFSQLEMIGEENLGSGGSDHDALLATFVV
mmetsp:Transcript_72099/g.190120  ORF Transcript_72099/g.190120 Transcript_72099/m.190120 type:complete len:317 (-) Transcript_72099:198-1148(-)